MSSVKVDEPVFAERRERKTVFVLRLIVETGSGDLPGTARRPFMAGPVFREGKLSCANKTTQKRSFPAYSGKNGSVGVKKQEAHIWRRVLQTG